MPRWIVQTVWLCWWSIMHDMDGWMIPWMGTYCRWHVIVHATVWAADPSTFLDGSAKDF
jgi:hypothetical protein